MVSPPSRIEANSNFSPSGVQAMLAPSTVRSLVTRVIDQAVVELAQRLAETWRQVPDRVRTGPSKSFSRLHNTRSKSGYSTATPYSPKGNPTIQKLPPLAIPV